MEQEHAPAGLARRLGNQSKSRVKDGNMFFQANGVNVIQFGTGDIAIAPGLLAEEEETIGSISLIPRPASEIDTRSNYGPGLPDVELGVHTRLTFTDVRSIDVLILQLEKVKALMRGEEQMDFFEAIRQDETMSKEDKQYWLAMEVDDEEE